MQDSRIDRKNRVAGALSAHGATFVEPRLAIETSRRSRSAAVCVLPPETKHPEIEEKTKLPSLRTATLPFQLALPLQPSVLAWD